MKCKTCQSESTVHIDCINVHLCESCLKKIDARLAEINYDPQKLIPPCGNCGGSGVVDSGGVTPWGSPIDLPCPSCTSKWDDLVIIGASWRKDSSLEKWFPFTALELAASKELQSRYDELIMAVELMFPGETRHQTALRYIKEAEHSRDGGNANSASNTP